MSDLANSLRQFRKVCKVTQKQAAAVAGITERNYQAYEYGKVVPTATVLSALADYFHVPIDFLTGRGIYAYWDDIQNNRESLTQLMAQAFYNASDKSKSLEDIRRSISDRVFINILPAFLKSVSHDESGGVVFELYFDHE